MSDHAGPELRAHLDLSSLPPQQPKRVTAQPVLRFTKSRPKRLQAGRWYYIEDNLVGDGKCMLRCFADGHGEVRCSAPTQRILNSSSAARSEVMGHYGKARGEMPSSIMCDVSKWAPPHLREMRRAMDPTAALKDGVSELLSALMKIKPEKLDDIDRADLVVEYGRLRERVRFLREEFSEIEASFELAQAKLVQVMGGDDE